jgi:hypothetical protein
MHHRGDLAARPVADRHHRIGGLLHTEVVEQRGGQDQPGVGDRMVIVPQQRQKGWPAGSA